LADLIEKNDLEKLVGTELGVSDWLKIDQERINMFADATIDHQFIHIDEEKAAKTPFGSTVAHGFLTASLLSHLAGDLIPDVKGEVMKVNYGCDKLRFLNPVQVNDEIRAHTKFAGFEEKAGNRLLLRLAVTVEIKNKKTPAMVAEWLALIILEE